MAVYRETVGNVVLPVVILKGVVAYPSSNIAFDIADPHTEAAISAAQTSGGQVLLLSLSEENATKKDLNMNKLEKKDFFSVGTVANIVSAVKRPDGKSFRRVVCAGMNRCEVKNLFLAKTYYISQGMVKDIHSDEVDTPHAKELIKGMHDAATEIAASLSHSTDELFLVLEKIKNPGIYADLIASSGILTSYRDRRDVLYAFDPTKRAELTLHFLEKQVKLVHFAATVNEKTHKRLSRAQKEYFLREQMNVIREELGDDQGDLASEFRKKIESADLPDEVRAGLTKECSRLARLPFGSAELSVIENHIELCLSLPWNKTTDDKLDVRTARAILDKDHYGLEKVKERIIEFLAVRKLNPDVKSQIICLVGPPGTGKTSVASSVSRALNRKFVRVSLGGIRDEAEIRGHRKTYIGSMPGRIINAIENAGVKNPLVLLDEIDKMSSDNHGDPSAAMLEVLDSEQNSTFRDHFVEYPFDLSEVFFITTANSLDRIPRPLLDRMEVIELGIYTETEKLMIAKNHLIPKQVKRHGLNGNRIRFTDGAIKEIINYYTREAGVRNLERTIADVVRKYAKKYEEMLAEGGDNTSIKRFTVTEKVISEYLGARKVTPDRLADEDEIGAVTGLAYTQVGGDTLEVEAVITEGKGKLKLTGSLGDIMKESASIAVTCARTVAKDYGYTADFTENKDIHIHVPGGAVPKDGPSAGITMCTALVSALSGIKVRHDIAMTGELSLRGNVLAIGGLKEKTMAAYQAGIRTVIIPKDNLPMLEDVDSVVRESISFIPCSTIGDVLNAALIK